MMAKWHYQVIDRYGELCGTFADREDAEECVYILEKDEMQAPLLPFTIRAHRGAVSND